MRLLHVDNLVLQEFPNPSKRPSYVILSHTWGDEEVTFEELPTQAAREKSGFSKIRQFCERAKRDGFEYVWVDTCCIDKRSSAELSEAINSMYRWYKEAIVCYAYMSDVRLREHPASLKIIRSVSQPQDDLLSYLPDEPTEMQGHLFADSRWFKRGWTLQELIAPQNVVFYDCYWVEIGTKNTLHVDISLITGVPSAVLVGKEKLGDICIAQRMSWAATRETTRVEDIAYCLMGLFGVNMPTLYGEGQNAFIRLQHEIMKGSDDHTLFTWIAPGQDDLRQVEPQGFLKHLTSINPGADASSQGFQSSGSSSVLAESPKSFRFGQFIRRTKASRDPLASYSSTNKGLHIWLPLILLDTRPLHPSVRLTMPDAVDPKRLLAILDCELVIDEIRQGLLGIFLDQDPSGQYRRISLELLGIVSTANAARHFQPCELYIVDWSMGIGQSLLDDVNTLQFGSILLHFDLSDCSVVECDPPGTWVDDALQSIEIKKAFGRCALRVTIDKDPTTMGVVTLSLERHGIFCDIYAPSDFSEELSLSDWQKFFLDRHKYRSSSIDRITRRFGTTSAISVAIKHGPIGGTPSHVLKRHRVLIKSGTLPGVSYKAESALKIGLDSLNSKYSHSREQGEGLRRDQDTARSCRVSINPANGSHSDSETRRQRPRGSSNLRRHAGQLQGRVGTRQTNQEGLNHP